MTRIPSITSQRSPIRVPSATIPIPSLSVPQLGPSPLAVLGQGISRVSDTLLQAQRARAITTNATVAIEAIDEAQAKAAEADPAEAVIVFEQQLKPFRDRLDELQDKVVRGRSMLDFERRLALGAVAVRRGAGKREGKLGIDTIDRLDDQLQGRLVTGSLLAVDAIADFAIRIQDFVGTSYDAREATERVQDFAADAIRREHDRLLRDDPEEAATVMKSELAIRHLPEQERRRRLAISEGALEERHAQVAEARVQAARRAIRERLTEEFVDAGEFAESMDATIADMKALPGFKVKGLFVKDRVATDNDLRMILLADELQLAATSGRRSAFEAIAKALPNTTEAQQAIVRGRSILDGVTRAAEAAEQFAIRRGQVLDAARTLMLNADVLHGAPLIEDVELALPNGVTKTITREQIIEAVVAETIPQLGLEGSTPDESLANQVQFLSRNGVTFEPFERVFAAGYLAVSTDFGAITKTGGLPANLKSAYELFKRMGAMNPRIRDQHIKDQTAQRFYEAASLAEKYVTPGDAESALLLTTKAFSRGTAFADPLANTITRKRFEKAIDSAVERGFSLFGIGNHRKARNISEIGAKVEQLARFYIQTIGLGADDAVEEAAQRIRDSHSIINDWAIDTGNINVPPDIGVVSELLIGDYVTRFGEEEAVDKDDLALIPGETEATWILFNQTTLMPVEQWREFGIFTNADLRRRSESDVAAVRHGIIQEQIPLLGNFRPDQGIIIPRLAPLRIGAQSKKLLKTPLDLGEPDPEALAEVIRKATSNSEP